MASSRPLTWRIQNIPADFTKERLKLCFHSDDKKCIEIKSLVPDVNNYDGDGTLTATMLFSPQEPREPRAEEYDDFYIDKNFIGFTPLNNPGKDVCADIIAVTGLAGHAFGSWAHSAQNMWLRDYLPREIKNKARILIYGYESQLHGAKTAKSIISDYGNSFAHSLMDIRDHPSCRKRPLILIGHSLGALIIKQAVTNPDPMIRSHLPVRTLIFFGAPHNGLEVTALETLVKGRPTQTLISELKPESPTLTDLAERFKHVAKDMSIHTYYESQPTRTVAKGPDGQWERCGEPKVMVELSSARLDFEKTRMKVDEDHKGMARLRRGQDQGGVYLNVLRIIEGALASASGQLASEIEAKEAWVDEPDPGVSINQNITKNTWSYDYNLICDCCYDEFPKRQKHRHCYICRYGNYNICRVCSANGKSCPGGHDMVSRQMDDAEEEPEEKKKDDSLRVAWCDLCGYHLYNHSLFFRCRICMDGNFTICLACRKSGNICVRGHKLAKPQAGTTTSNATAGKTQEGVAFGCLPERRSRPQQPAVENRKPYDRLPWEREYKRYP